MTLLYNYTGIRYKIEMQHCFIEIMLMHTNNCYIIFEISPIIIDSGKWAALEIMTRYKAGLLTTSGELSKDPTLMLL